MSFDTIIRGGTVATASDTFSCDVGISKGRIAALGGEAAICVIFPCRAMTSSIVRNPAMVFPSTSRKDF